MENAPDKLIDYARANGVSAVYFVDDREKCNRSIRFQTDIWVNTRCTFWDAMIPPPFCCNDACEAILLRYLHEVGHISLHHQGDPDLKSTASGLQLGQRNDFFMETFNGSEGEAWEFALKIRKHERAVFSNLYDSCKKWYVRHIYINKDWDDDSQSMWKRIHKQSLNEVQFSLPEWVYARFRKYLPDSV